MLGRRSPQLGLFDAQTLPHRVPPDSFYGQMSAVSGMLFRDEDLEAMYDPDTGRPSLPPSLMCGVLSMSSTAATRLPLRARTRRCDRIARR